jgi:hypothetical protein
LEGVLSDLEIITFPHNHKKICRNIQNCGSASAFSAGGVDEPHFFCAHGHNKLRPFAGTIDLNGDELRHENLLPKFKQFPVRFEVLWGSASTTFISRLNSVRPSFLPTRKFMGLASAMPNVGVFS